MTRRRGLAALALGLALAACPKDEAPPDRAIELLKAEQARLQREGPATTRRPSPPEPLAEIVAADARPETLGIPRDVAADLGAVTLSLTEVQIAQTVGQRVKLSTTDQFVRVTLEASARAPTELELAGAQLVLGDQTYPLARDAQRAAGGSPLSTKIHPGGSTELVLFFEAPRAALRPGLKIVLSSAESRVELALQ